MIYCPIKKTVHGPVKSMKDLLYAINRNGQHFGVDESGPACNYNPSYPCNVTLYEHMGWGKHKGIDIPCATGTEIYAAHDGFVQKTSETVSQGIGIVIRKDGEHETVYWHNERNLVKVGDTVKAGQLIGYSDNTGQSGGPHLHFELKLWNGSSYEATDPLPHITFNTMERIVRADKDIYRLKNGAKDLFLNKKSFESLDGRWDKVESITKEELALIPDGDVLIAVPNE